ncbi:MerR family transcriptional regulator [Jeotgalicoccus nanhaiensis]|uniref:MerR family transcriptional regulator n=1 Tax=Jeotgalicoccus nanhaiensis TaxID=568603 RepID=A0ABR9Y0F1_9STAP|nr:MerR family transcriptional regulator [Jeotgalicoccus nanhaiensis]MBF0754515.1 MerR family transcriptional regulator [Jeotgalicoccus nanhaiensis]TFU61035.1 MerR family transcriptional regulator [Jeotgalicoccus nanhaiensis]
MKIKELAELSGVSVRTLHHYDAIGLLTPETDAVNGYRNYSDEDISRLQQILFFRQLNFKLRQIKDILDSPHYIKREALQMQKDIILKEQARLESIVKLIDKTIKEERGEITMTNEEKFEGVDFSQNLYEDEAREKWGSQSVDESKKNLKKMGAKDAEQKFNSIYTELSKVRHMKADSKEAQALIHEWYEFLNEIGEYTPEMFKGLGDMYTKDERFKQNIDKFGEGLADFMQQAMTVYYENHKK